MLDCVIMEGSTKILPWESKVSNFRLLFQMCKLTDKPLYASGFGMQFLAHFCAVGNKKLTVINGKEKGGEIKSLSKYDADDYKQN